MRIVQILLLTFYCTVILSQSTELDSLLNEFRVAPTNEGKVDLLNEIAFKASLIDVDSSYNYATQALDLATQIGYASGKARALNIKSNKFLLGKKHLQTILINNEALSIAKEIDDHKNLSRIYNSIAVNYYNMGDQEMAIKNLQLAADASQLIRDTTRSLYTLSNIGYLHLQNNSLVLAEKYLLNASQLAEESRSQIGMRLVTRHLGALYAAFDNYDLAMDYFHKGINLSIEENDLFNLAWNKALLGKYLSRKREFAKAEENILEGLQLFEQRKDLENQLEVCGYLVEHYNRRKDFNRGISTSLDCLERIGNEGYYKHKVIFLNQLSIAYEGIGDTENAYKCYKKYKVYSDSLLTRESRMKAIEIESKYQIDKKEVENKLLIEEKANQKVVISRRNNTIVASFILLFLLATIAILFWRNAKKEQRYSLKLESKVQERTHDLLLANRDLSQSNEELERFAYIASHDLKEPVRNIISFTELLEKEIGDDKNERVKSFMNIIHQNSQHMFSLIRDTLEFSKIESENNIVESVDLNKTIKDIETTISTTIQKEKAILKIKRPLPVLNANKTQLYIVFKNLIENGIKYNESENPTILIDHIKKEKEYIFSIKDNGIGIDATHYDRIFEMYKRLKMKEGLEGTGLGLATCKKIIQQLGGNIWIESNQGEGSTFKFTLPYS